METTVEVKNGAETTALVPTAEELAVLSPFERFAFRLAWRMNRGRWKRLWTLCQRTLGAGWIHVSTYNLMRVARSCSSPTTARSSTCTSSRPSSSA
jgi:hypothetical protein